MKLTLEELESQKLSPQHLQFAVQLVKVNGYVVLESVLPSTFVDELHTEFMRVFEAYVALRRRIELFASLPLTSLDKIMELSCWKYSGPRYRRREGKKRNSIKSSKLIGLLAKVA